MGRSRGVFAVSLPALLLTIAAAQQSKPIPPPQAPGTTASERGASSLPRSSPTPILDLKRVHTVYMGRFGESPDAERLRMVLSIELPHRGYVMVHTLNDADAELQGVLTVHDSIGGAVVTCTAELINLRGDRLWAGEYGPRGGIHGAFPHTEDGVKKVGEKIGQDLRKATDKAK